MAFNRNDTKTIPCNNVSNQKGMTLQKEETNKSIILAQITEDNCKFEKKR